MFVVGKFSEHKAGLVLQLPLRQRRAAFPVAALELIPGNILEGLDASGIQPQSAALVTAFGDCQVRGPEKWRPFRANINHNVDIEQ